MLCLRVTIFDRPHALINIHMPCTNEPQRRKVLRRALTGALARYASEPEGRELVVGGDFNGVLDEHDLIAKPSQGEDDPRISQHIKTKKLLEDFGVEDAWRAVMKDAPTFTHKYTNSQGHHGGSRLDTFALTPQTLERVTCMEQLLGYPGD